MNAASPGAAATREARGPAPAAGATATPADHRVGPNAVIQTRAALQALCGSAVCDSIFDAAGLGRLDARRLEQLVEARLVNDLNEAVVRQLPPALAREVMAHAGALTADYVMAHRIPSAVRRLLPRLPRPLARRLLLAAIGKHAWTFAGHARVETRADRVIIHDNPICLGRSSLGACVWHVGVFSRLLQALVDPRIRVREERCAGRGDGACHFRILTG